MEARGKELTLRDWLVLAGMFMLGCVITITLMVRAMGGGDGGVITFTVPGSTEINLPGGGRYFVYEEYQRTQDSQGIIRPEGAKDVLLTLTRVEDGAVIPLAAAPAASSYKRQRLYGESLYTFDAPAAGAYTVTGVYEDSGSFTFSIGQGSALARMGSFLMVWVIMPVTLLCMVLYLLWRRRGMPE